MGNCRQTEGQTPTHDAPIPSSNTICRLVRQSLWQPLGELAQWVPSRIHTSVGRYGTLGGTTDGHLDIDNLRSVRASTPLCLWAARLVSLLVPYRCATQESRQNRHWQ